MNRRHSGVTSRRSWEPPRSVRGVVRAMGTRPCGADGLVGGGDSRGDGHHVVRRPESNEKHKAGRGIYRLSITSCSVPSSDCVPNARHLSSLSSRSASHQVLSILPPAESQIWPQESPPVPPSLGPRPSWFAGRLVCLDHSNGLRTPFPPSRLIQTQQPRGPLWSTIPLTSLTCSKSF